MDNKLYISIIFLMMHFSAFCMEAKNPASLPKSIELSPIELAILQHQSDLEIFKIVDKKLEIELKMPLEYRILNRNRIKSLSDRADRAAAQEQFSMIRLLAISPTHKKFIEDHGLR